MAAAPGSNIRCRDISRAVTNRSLVVAVAGSDGSGAPRPVVDAGERWTGVAVPAAVAARWTKGPTPAAPDGVVETCCGVALVDDGWSLPDESGEPSSGATSTGSSPVSGATSVATGAPTASAAVGAASADRWTGAGSTRSPSAAPDAAAESPSPMVLPNGLDDGALTGSVSPTVGDWMTDGAEESFGCGGVPGDVDEDGPMLGAVASTCRCTLATPADANGAPSPSGRLDRCTDCAATTWCPADPVLCTETDEAAGPAGVAESGARITVDRPSTGASGTGPVGAPD